MIVASVLGLGLTFGQKIVRFFGEYGMENLSFLIYIRVRFIVFRRIEGYKFGSWVCKDPGLPFSKIMFII